MKNKELYELIWKAVDEGIRIGRVQSAKEHRDPGTEGYDFEADAKQVEEELLIELLAIFDKQKS